MSGPDMPDDVAAVVAGWSAPARARMGEIRALILEAARDCEVGPLSEVLKWGEPSWLTEVSGAGTTVRVGWKQAREDHVAVLVHCQTDLVDRYRAHFPSEFTYDGDRAVLVPVEGPVAWGALRGIVAMALTYKRDKKAGRRAR